MNHTVKIAIITALTAILTPFSAMAASTTTASMTVVADFKVLKKAMKEVTLKADNLLIKKTFFGALKKVEAVSAVYEDATSIPSTAYFTALEKAANQYAKDRAKAGGNKKKLEAADEAYARAVEEASALYLIPIEEESK